MNVFRYRILDEDNLVHGVGFLDVKTLEEALQVILPPQPNGYRIEIDALDLDAAEPEEEADYMIGIDLAANEAYDYDTPSFDEYEGHDDLDFAIESLRISQEDCEYPDEDGDPVLWEVSHGYLDSEPTIKVVRA